MGLGVFVMSENPFGSLDPRLQTLLRQCDRNVDVVNRHLLKVPHGISMEDALAGAVIDLCADQTSRSFFQP
jgi:hypothetical protein